MAKMEKIENFKCSRDEEQLESSLVPLNGFSEFGNLSVRIDPMSAGTEPLNPGSLSLLSLLISNFLDFDVTTKTWFLPSFIIFFTVSFLVSSSPCLPI